MKTETIKTLLDLFKVCVIDASVPTTTMGDGWVTNFVPTPEQRAVLDEVMAPLPIKTLFSLEERLESDIRDLILKQYLHYIEVYGLGRPGLFDLEVENGVCVSLCYVQAADLDWVQTSVRSLITSERPIKDAVALAKAIGDLGFRFDPNEVKNNELRVLLFHPDIDTFEDGDDLVRWMCMAATGSPLLIKSDEVVGAVKTTVFDPTLLERHELQLARVFNRHKRLILAAKGPSTKSAINRISRLSKVHHVPIQEPMVKTIVGRVVRDESVDLNRVANFSIRDRLKLLNVVSERMSYVPGAAFVIRNGKVHVDPDSRRNLPSVNQHVRLSKLRDVILYTLKTDLSTRLDGQTIVLDPHVDFGIPTSRKQTLGRLPFGTRIDVGSRGDHISSGIYWHESGGAQDLDLSTIDDSGVRVGWGQMSGFGSSDVVYSGDITSAQGRGSMEFMTSSIELKKTYGVYVNVYNGAVPSKASLVVGPRGRDNWIDDTLVREEFDLSSRAIILGYVVDGQFVVYTTRVGGGRVSSSDKDQTLAKRGIIHRWTVRDLFDTIGIEYTTAARSEVDHDLTYAGFTIDRLERLLGV